MTTASIAVFATEYDKMNSKMVLYEEGSDFTLYENGIERHFTHNITHPVYLYEMGAFITIAMVVRWCF
jgi:hypothetical protein